MIKWGILATGNIANSFAEDFQYVSGGILRAVASRNIEKAQAFAENTTSGKPMALTKNWQPTRKQMLSTFPLRTANTTRTPFCC